LPATAPCLTLLPAHWPSAGRLLLGLTCLPVPHTPAHVCVCMGVGVCMCVHVCCCAPVLLLLCCCRCHSAAAAVTARPLAAAIAAAGRTSVRYESVSGSIRDPPGPEA
jgi:hypothetical protein